MIKKTKPNIAIPSEFAVVGEKRDFSEVKIQNGFDPFDKDTLEGSCLNKFIDDTYKGLNYSMAGTDAINLIKEGETLTSKNGNLESMPVVSTDLTGLTASGDNRLHALKGYLDDGELLTDAEGLADVVNYAHSTFDLSKFTVVGSPNITDDGIARGFVSQTNFLNATYTSTTPTTSVDIWTKVIITDTTETSGVYWAIDGNLRLMRSSATAIGLRGFSGALSCDVTGLRLALNDEVIIHANVTGTNATVDILVNGVKSSNTVTHSNTIESAYSHLVVGGQYSNGNYSPKNSIDLKYQRVLFDGVEVFSGNKTGLDVIKPDDYTVVGTPTISADGVASGFSSSNYLQTNFTYNTFIANFSYTWNGTNPTASSFIYRVKTTNSYEGISIYQKSNGYLDIVTNVANSSHYDFTNFAISANIPVLISVAKTETSLSVNAFQNGINIYSKTVETNIPTFDNSSIFQIGKDLIYGSIDLNSIKVYVYGNLVYQPCLKIPYTLSKTGSKIADASVRNRVVDMYGQFGYAPYYTLDEANGNFTLPQGEIYGMIEKSKTTGFLGQTVFSLDPLFNDGLHLLDGALLQGDGVYKSFIDNYIKPLYNSTPSRFVTETVWQQSVSTHGVCGFYVYDSTNNTVRLPKVTGFVEGTLDASALGSLVEAGLPLSWLDHTHTRGDMNITGSFQIGYDWAVQVGHVDGAFSSHTYYENADVGGSDGGSGNVRVGFNAANTWTGSTSAPNYVTTVHNSNTVQPQSIKGYMYIVVANNVSSAATVNQSGIITEVANKLDTDGSNAPSKLSEALLSRFMPDYENVITASFSSGVWTQVTKDSFVVSEGADSYAENYSVYVSPNQSTLYKVGGRYDDTNGNTQTTSFSFFVPKNWYFKNEAENGGTHFIYPLKGAN